MLSIIVLILIWYVLVVEIFLFSKYILPDADNVFYRVCIETKGHITRHTNMEYSIQPPCEPLPSGKCQ